MADKEKKMREQIDEEILDQVTGGYSKENWLKMNPEERVAAYKESQAKRKADGNAYCAFYDPNA